MVGAVEHTHTHTHVKLVTRTVEDNDENEKLNEANYVIDRFCVVLSFQTHPPRQVVGE